MIGFDSRFYYIGADGRHAVGPLKIFGGWKIGDGANRAWIVNSGSHYLTPEEVAEILKVDRATIYKHLRAGAIPAFRFGKLWRINENDLEGLLKKKKVG